jgi:hypothetical protein
MMAGTSFYVRQNGLKQDRFLHEPIIQQVDFPKSPAYRFALRRAQRLGVTTAAAKEVLDPQKRAPEDE